MALKGLSQFNTFDLIAFLREKRVLFVKALPWLEKDKKTEQSKAIGSKVIVQIWEDNTPYANPAFDNFGEQLTIKVRDVEPSTFDKWKPLETEVFVANVEYAALYGEFRNQISAIASVSTKSTQ